MDHNTTRATILPAIISLIMERFGYDERKALDSFYRSATGANFADDETGLYGQSALFVFSLFCNEMDRQAS